MELKGFKKLNESTSPELLSPEELTISENLVLDEEIGRPKKRFGWQRFNTNPTAGTILSLHEVVTSDSSNYILAGHTSKLQKSLAGTASWTDVTSKGEPPYRMQPYADEFIFTDGSVPPFLVSGASLETTNDLEIEPPDISLIETSHSVGGNLTAVSKYKWIFVYVTDTGQVSAPSIPFTAHYDVAISGTIEHPTTGNTIKRIGFKNLPVSTDSRVTARYIYRTMADTDVYYFHSQIDNIITSWYDESADSDLGSESLSFINIPQTSKYISLHKERIIFGNITRTVKNWIMPAYSHRSTTQFDVTYKGTTITFDQLNSVDIKTLSAVNTGTDGYYGSLTAGDYTYRFVFYDNSGLISDYIESDPITITDNQVIVIFAPPYVADGYDAIARGEVYRSKDSGSFYLVKEYNPQNPDTVVINSTSAWCDTGWVAGIEFSSNQTTDSEKCGVAFSQIGQPATYVLEDVRNIFPDDGDQITGVFDDLDGIVVFKEKSINKIYTNGAPDNWRLVKLLPNIGCDEPNSLIKYGNTYAFSFQDSIYTWNSQGGLKEIGIEIWDTLSQVTAYHSATADSGWYMFGVSGAGLTSGYGFLVYDYNLETWYKFTTTTVPYTAKIKENGNDIGTILTTSGTYLLWYSEAVVDGDTGSDVQITAKLRTKTFGEAIALLRLRKLKFSYKKLDGQNVVITVVNPDTTTTNTYTDSTDATIDDGWKLYESPVKETDSLKETSKFYINIEGAGLTEFGSFRLEAKPILRGKRDINAG